MEYYGLRYRAYLDKGQYRLLMMHAGACRVVWNLALEQRQAALAAWRQAGSPKKYTWPSFVSQCRELRELRNDPEVARWLQETPMQVLQQTLRDLDRAWGRWLQGKSKRPRFKKRTGEQRFRDPQKVYVTRQSKRWATVKIQGVGHLPIRLHRPVAGVVKHATVIREADGKWFVSLTVERRVRESQPSKNSPVGVDLGVVVPVATSDGELVGEGFETLRPKEQERLLRLERQLARCERGSQNKQRVQLKINRLRARQRRRRKDFVEQVSHDLAKNHGLVVFENLQVKSMTRSARGSVDEPGTNVRQKAGLNRVILDRSWSMLRKRTEEKAGRFGTSVGYVPAAYSSQECPGCGNVDAESRVSRGLFVCTACGHQGHADVKAAITVLDRALAGGLVLSVAGGTPAAASRGYDRGRPSRKQRAAESSGKPAQGSRNTRSAQGRGRITDARRNRAEASLPSRAG